MELTRCGPMGPIHPVWALPATRLLDLDMARSGLILTLDEATDLRINTKPPLTQKMLMEMQQIPTESQMAPAHDPKPGE